MNKGRILTRGDYQETLSSFCIRFETLCLVQFSGIQVIKGGKGR